MSTVQRPDDRSPMPVCGLRELAAAIASGECTSQSAVAASLMAIDAIDGRLNTFRITRAEQALSEAADADRRRAAGQRLPLLGVPVAIKDDADIAGSPTAMGCGGDFEPKSVDSAMVGRLKASGAVVVGKTHTPELGQWPVTSGQAFGYTRNPWNREHTPGGSSGGAAAAVAAGMVPAALGSDGGGSIRIPAGWTNLVGIKPQRGRVPTDPHPEIWNGLAVLGPIARTVADAALLLDVVSDDSGPPVSDSVGVDPGRLRIAVALRPPFTLTRPVLDPEVEASVLTVAAALRKIGHSVAVADPRYGVLLAATLPPRMLTGIRAGLQSLPPGAQSEPRTRAHARGGLLLQGPALRAARRAEPHLQRRIGKFFENFDVILAPTAATPPPKVEILDGLSLLATQRLVINSCPYTWPWNVLGWPSINVPAGFTDGGLPLGAQLMGTADSEGLLVSVAAQLESQLRWDRHRPDPWWLDTRNTEQGSWV